MANKLYEVTERSFINGRLYEKGERLVMHIDSPGSNLKEVGAAKGPAAVSTNQAGNESLPQTGTSAGANSPGNTGTEASSTAFHIGGGRYGIKDVSGERIGTFIGTKEEAEAEAARMATGDPDLSDQDNDLPDA